MTWVQIILLVLQLLKQFKDSESAEVFAADVQASGLAPQVNGDVLKWLWENREQIIQFVLTLIGMFEGGLPVTTQSDELAELKTLVTELQS